MHQPDEHPEASWDDPANAAAGLLRQWIDDPAGGITPAQVAARRAAGSLRGLIARLADTSASLEQLEELADRLDAAVAAMPEGAVAGGPGGEPGAAEASMALPSELQRLLERSPIVGLANPVAAPMRMEVFPDHIVGHVRFSRAYEGPPGHVHGGFVAAVFDELLGSTQILSGRAGMTGRLAIDYRSPTPLETDLRLEGRIKGSEGRKILCQGTLHAGETLCAEAEGLFVSIGPERFEQLRDARRGPKGS
jgi:acyl-coenzyme A thioesterase PaaI-like protein